VVPVVFTACSFFAVLSYAQTYTLTDLGTLGGNCSFASGINNTGQVTGSSDLVASTSCSPSMSPHHAFLYSPGPPSTMMDLQTFGKSGLNSGGIGINDVGQVTGSSDTDANGDAHAFLYPVNGVMQDVGTLGGLVSAGYSINSAGQITGSSAIVGGAPHEGEHAFLYAVNGAMYDLNAVAPNGTILQSGNGINAAGQITGILEQLVNNFDADALLYTPPSIAIGLQSCLSGPNPPGSIGYGINSVGQVTGFNCAGHAVRYSNGAVIDLGTLGGPTSAGYAINAAGQVVGYSSLSSGISATHATLWTGDTPIDLNLQIRPASPSIVLTAAAGINDKGWIVADGTDSAGFTRSYLLTPILSQPPCEWIGAIGAKWSGYTVCPLTVTFLPPHFQPVCDVPCNNPVAIWTLPLPLNDSDPGFDGISVSIFADTMEQVHRVAAEMQVTVSIELPGPLSQHTAIVGLIERGASSPVRALIVGPFLDVSAAAGRIMQISVPYDVKTAGAGRNLRLVRLDQAKGRWVDVGTKSINVAQHLITARVSISGRYTIVMETQSTDR
jgi:probable HAF family extracellular repeat protein